MKPTRSSTRSIPRPAVRTLGWLLLCLVNLPTTTNARLCLDYTPHPESNPALPYGGALFDEAILDLGVLAGHAYLTTEGGNLRIVELSNPTVPFEVANFPLGSGPAQCIAVLGCRAYVGRGGTLHVVDITSANDPQLAGSGTYLAEILDVAVADNLLAVALADSSLATLYAPECGDPTGTGTAALGYSYGCVDVAGDVIFLGGAGRVAAVRNIPAEPLEQLGWIAVPGTVRDLCVWGDTLVAVTADRLLLLDLTTGGLPSLLDEKLFPATGALAATAVDRQLHIATEAGSWWVYSPDHQQLREPVGWGILPAPGLAAVIDGPAVFFAAGLGGLQVAWPQCVIDPPTAVGEGPAATVPNLSVSPNPGNPLFNIRLDGLPPGPASLKIFDLAGRRVKTLASGDLGSGPATYRWNGCNASGKPLASGSYLVVLDSAAGRTTTSVVLLR